MHPLAKTAVVLVALAAPLHPFQANPPEQTSSLEGTVVNAVSGDALRRVGLTLLPIHGKGKETNAASDASGRFTFRNVVPGTYRLSGERPGFHRQQHGARLNPESGTVVGLAAGEPVKDLVFKLVPDAVISGGVLDQEGAPLPGLIVVAMSQSYVRGKRQWHAAGSAQTNDRGEYRLSGLRAGRYIVVATDLNVGIGLAGISKDSGGDKPEQAYASTYYGNAMDSSRAAPIDLRAGDDRRGANIQMIKTATVRIKGKVVDFPEGKTVLLTLVPRNTVAVDIGRMGLAQQDGTFEIKNAVPGSYLLTSRSTDDLAKSAGALALEVADRNIDGVEFRLASGGDVSGRMLIPADKPAPDLEIEMQPADFDLGAAPAARPDAEGRFTLKNVFALRYRLRVRGLPEGGYLRSVKLGGRSIDEDEMDVAPGAQLELTISLAGAQVEGTAGPGATVVLIPESRRESRYVTGTADEKGVFTLKGIAPGRYQAIAFEDLESGAFRDPEFIKRFEDAAVAVALTEGARAKVTLAPVPFDRISAAQQP
jgi:hypothetical protein